MSALTSIGLPEIIAGLMLLALTAYALTGGADFGGASGICWRGARAASASDSTSPPLWRPSGRRTMSG
jgi:hypothetical protein